MEKGGRANLSVFNFNGNNKLKKFHKKNTFVPTRPSPPEKNQFSARKFKISYHNNFLWKLEKWIRQISNPKLKS